MDDGFLGMIDEDPFEYAAAEERLLGRALRDLDVRVDGAVVVMQRKAGRLVFLRVAQQDDGLRERSEMPGRIRGRRPGLDELRTAGRQSRLEREHDGRNGADADDRVHCSLAAARR